MIDPGADPKFFCGYSDITSLPIVIYACTGLVTCSRPHFFTFGMQLGLEYSAFGNPQLDAC